MIEGGENTGKTISQANVTDQTPTHPCDIKIRPEINFDDFFDSTPEKEGE